MKNIQKQRGQIALISVLIIAAAALIVALAMSSGGINESIISFDDEQSERAFQIADACVDEGLLRLQRVHAGEEVSYSGGTLNFGTDSCTITVTVLGSNRVVDVESTVNAKIHRKIQAIAQWTPTYELISWQEQE
ncbi:hypothetical protein KKH43_00665 [Patescibacteria group bacterium]|nr:hypothetical protein [Patescibacteria group bacterium]